MMTDTLRVVALEAIKELPPIVCSVVECDAVAVESLKFANQIGHVHVCPQHAAEDREWADVIASAPIVQNVCVYPGCTIGLYIAKPTPLEDTLDI